MSYLKEEEKRMLSDALKTNTSLTSLGVGGDEMNPLIQSLYEFSNICDEQKSSSQFKAAGISMFLWKLTQGARY